MFLTIVYRFRARSGAFAKKKIYIIQHILPATCLYYTKRFRVPVYLPHIEILIIRGRRVPSCSRVAYNNNTYYYIQWQRC